MTKSVTQRTTLNYNNEPLKDGEVLVLMRFDEDERDSITNPNSIVTVPTAGGYVKAVLKAVPKEFEAVAKEQFNSWVRDIKPVHYGRCRITQPDGTEKICPKKKGDNHPDCAHCPHNGEYEREMPKVVSLEALQEKGWDPASSCSPEAICIRREERIEANNRFITFFETLIDISPKHALAVLMKAQHIEGQDFYDKMHLSHDAACRVWKQFENLAPKGTHRFDQIRLSDLKANRSKEDAYYLEEARAMLDTVLKMCGAK